MGKGKPKNPVPRHPSDPIKDRAMENARGDEFVTSEDVINASRKARRKMVTGGRNVPLKRNHQGQKPKKRKK